LGRASRTKRERRAVGVHTGASSASRESITLAPPGNPGASRAPTEERRAQEHEFSYAGLSSETFESLAYDILERRGFSNLQWRDGGVDGGRDIVADYLQIDASGFEQQQKWFVDAKIYSSGIGFDAIHPTLARATSNNPDYLLFVVHPHLTPQCKDELQRWEENNRPRFRVRFWEKKTISSCLAANPDLLRKHLPQEWSQTVEMEAYLSEATEVLRNFVGRIKPVWHSAESRPILDSMRIVAKDKTIPVVGWDCSNKLTDDERRFVRALLSAYEYMNQIVAATFRPPNGTFLMNANWAGVEGARLLLQIRRSDALPQDRRDMIQHVLHDFHPELVKKQETGLISLCGNFPPYDEDHRVGLYAFIDEALATP